VPVADLDTTSARAALATIRSAVLADAPLPEPGESRAHDIHIATDLPLEDARLTVVIAEQWGHLAGIQLAVALGEFATGLQVAVEQMKGQHRG
jgi:hypothetical protein